MSDDRAKSIRPSPIAGMWYPGEPDRLARQVDQCLAVEQAAPDGDIIGVMAPHAGYRYSGAVAGYAYKAVQGLAVDTVAVVGPLHRGSRHMRAATTKHQAYHTPLGDVPVDDLSYELGRAFDMQALGQDQEHSIEMQLPFLQRALPQPFSLIPIMMVDQSAPTAQALGQALAAALEGRRALLVASTDLSHFYDQATAKQFDAVMLDHVAAFDPQGLLEAERDKRGFACGRGAVAAVMWAAAALGADAADVVHYATSGDVSGDYARVVGYGAAIFYRHV